MLKNLMITLLVLEGLFWTDASALEIKTLNNASLNRYSANMMATIQRSMPDNLSEYGGDSCEVSFKQDRYGYVREVKVLTYTSAKLCREVLKGIISASPLPNSPKDFQEEIRITVTP